MKYQPERRTGSMEDYIKRHINREAGIPRKSTTEVIPPVHAPIAKQREAAICNETFYFASRSPRINPRVDHAYPRSSEFAKKKIIDSYMRPFGLLISRRIPSERGKN